MLPPNLTSISTSSEISREALYAAPENIDYFQLYLRWSRTIQRQEAMCAAIEDYTSHNSDNYQQYTNRLKSPETAAQTKREMFVVLKPWYIKHCDLAMRRWMADQM